MSLLQYLNLIFMPFIEESEIVPRRSSITKVFLKILQNSLENTCAGVSFAIKLQAESLCNLIKRRLQYRCFPVNFEKSLRTSTLQTSAKICFRKVRSGVSFRKVLGFYYKQKGQPFFYKETLRDDPLKIPERINGVSF